MSEKQGGAKRRRFLPWAFIGILIGAVLAFTLARWQKRAMPWTALDREEDDLSIYETSGDVTEDWPADAMDGGAGLKG